MIFTTLITSSLIAATIVLGVPTSPSTSLEIPSTLIKRVGSPNIPSKISFPDRIFCSYGTGPTKVHWLTSRDNLLGGFLDAVSTLNCDNLKQCPVSLTFHRHDLATDSHAITVRFFVTVQEQNDPNPPYEKQRIYHYHPKKQDDQGTTAVFLLPGSHEPVSVKCADLYEKEV